MAVDRRKGSGPKVLIAAGYHAIISYRERQDSWLAPAFQVGLERFAKPWYRIRALRVFRDTASLAASPERWASVEAALRASRWFVLLTSPEAARSSWVDREVSWWLANRPAGRLLFVATAALLRWDTEAGDLAAATPVPPALRAAFRAEPLWVDPTGLNCWDLCLPTCTSPWGTCLIGNTEEQYWRPNE